MHPLLKRILVNGVLTAAILAGVGLLFSQLASMWATTNATKPNATDGNAPLSESIRTNVPLMMAFWGFVFVAVCELIRWRLGSGKQPVAKPNESQPDDVEKLLNELLAQAESKKAMEEELQRTEDREQRAEDNGQKTEEQKPT